MKQAYRVFFLGLFFAVVLGSSYSPAQQATPSPPTATADPIQCWSRTERTTTRIGEPLGLWVTCRIVWTEDVHVVVNESVLAPEGISLAPFEVMSGSRFPDVHSGPFIFFQYEYQLRIKGPVFGKEISTPAFEFSYAIEQKTDSGEFLKGQSQAYKFAALPILVESLVPKDAKDIRDVSSKSFGEITHLRNVGYGAIGLAGVFLVVALVVGILEVRRFVRVRQPVLAPGTLSEQMIAHAVYRELLRIKHVRQTDAGYPFASSALAALRVAGALALGTSVTQRQVMNAIATSGTFLVRPSRWKRRRVELSASTTAEAFPSTHTMGRALREFTDTQYGGANDLIKLDGLLIEATASSRLALRQYWRSVRLWKRLSESFEAWRS